MSENTKKNVNNDQPEELSQNPQAAPEAFSPETSDAQAGGAEASVDLIMVDGAGDKESSDEGTSVKRAKFSPLPANPAPTGQGSIDLLLDVQLGLTVELGRASVPVRDVLQLGPGSIVALDKLSGESVDILVNGKLIARGEVVIVDESFGVRVTEMVSKSDSTAQVV